MPGDNTRQARKRFDRDVIAKHPHFVTISFGINDSAVDVNKGSATPRVTLREYQENILWMVDRLQSRGIRPIIMTPNPVGWTDELKSLYDKAPYRPDEPNGWNVHLTDYALAVRQFAKDRNLPLIDTYQLFQSYAARPGKCLNDLLIDGMHPNDAGHAIIAGQLLQFVTSEEASKTTRDRDVR